MQIPEIAAEQLRTNLEGGQETHLLDIRLPSQLADVGKIEAGERFHNIPLGELLERGLVHFRLDRDKDWAVVCTRGNDSKKVTALMCEQGYRAASMHGGMMEWMKITAPRELEPPAGIDRFIQFDRVGKGSLSYALISDGEALVVDPPQHTARILEALGDARLVAVADTHAHADYISGAPRMGVPYHLHAKDAIYPYDGTPGHIEYVPANEGATIPFGRARVRVIHTPGHTEGSVCYAVGDEVALTGDFLFVQSVGRPDLGERTEEWTQVLFDSLERARAEFSDSVRIHPAHYSSDSERNADRTIGRPFGDLRVSNPQLAETDRDAFAAWVRARAGSFPEQYKRIKGVNVGIFDCDEEEMNELELGRNRCALR